MKLNSANTSINSISRLAKHLFANHNKKIHLDILDYGGGKYSTTTEYLSKRNITNWIYDPHNRSFWENFVTINRFIKPHTVMICNKPEIKVLSGPGLAKIIMCSNVLNVLNSEKQDKVLSQISLLLDESGSAYFTIYEGDHSHRGKKTSKGWQENKPTRSYIKKIKRHFPLVKLLPKKIIQAKFE